MTHNETTGTYSKLITYPKDKKTIGEMISMKPIESGYQVKWARSEVITGEQGARIVDKNITQFKQREDAEKAYWLMSLELDKREAHYKQEGANIAAFVGNDPRPLPEGVYTDEQFESHLSGFIGTVDYKRHNMMRNLYATDGAMFVFENGGKVVDNQKHGAYWLWDVIMSYAPSPRFRREQFQVWKLTKRNRKETKEEKQERLASGGKQPTEWIVTMDDGNGNVKIRQIIPYSDFRLDSITLYVTWGSLDGETGAWIVMLPSEY